MRCEAAERPHVWSGEPRGGGGGAGQEVQGGQGGEGGDHHRAPAGDSEVQGLQPAGGDVLGVQPGLPGEGPAGGGGQGGAGLPPAGHLLAAGAPPVRRPGPPPLRLSARQLRLPGRRTPGTLGSHHWPDNSIRLSTSASLQTSGWSEGSPHPAVQCGLG